MGEWIDWYHVLQVHSEAEPEVIQGAYKRLCKKYHPDVNTDPGVPERIRQINGAWQVLGDPEARRGFHREWQRRNAQPAVRDRIVYREVVSETGAYGAHRVLHTYLDALSKGRLPDAFAQISRRDQSRFGYEQFAQWQQAVARCYEMGRFTLSFFKRPAPQPVSAYGRLLAEEHTVTLWEKNRQTGAVRQYSFAKTVIYEGGQWRVFLGYEDLAPLIAQFTQASHAGQIREGEWPEEEAFGLLGRDAFICRLEEEIGRFRRYGRVFSVALILTDASAAQKTVRIGRVLAHMARKTDVVACVEPGCLGVLLTETGPSKLETALARLTHLARQEANGDIRTSARVYAGGTAAFLLHACRMQLGHWTRTG